MIIQIVIMDIAGNILRGVWTLACAAILYYFADAVFYHGAWWNVGYTALVATLLFWASSNYDAAFDRFLRRCSEQDTHQESARFSRQPRRRTIDVKAPVNGHFATRDANQNAQGQ